MNREPLLDKVIKELETYQDNILDMPSWDACHFKTKCAIKIFQIIKCMLEKDEDETSVRKFVEMKIEDNAYEVVHPERTLDIVYRDKAYKRVLELCKGKE